VNSKKALVLACAAALLPAPPSRAQSPSPATPQALNAQEADIRAFVQDVARRTGRTFVIDPRVKGTVTVYGDGDLSEAEVNEVFLATLRANGLVAAPGPNGVTVIRPADALSQQPAGQGGSFATEVIRLREMDATTVADMVRPYVSGQGQVVAAPRSNAIIVTDFRENLSRLRQLLAQVDQDLSTTQTVTLRNSAAKEMAEVLKQLHGGGQNGQPGGALSIVPVASSNSLILRGDAQAIARAAALVQDLDQRAESAADVRVVRLQNIDAAQILPVLQEVVGQTGARPGAEGQAAAAPTSDVRISRYAGANALVIKADQETQRTLAEVIRKLDVRRPQVRVEAIVVEISDSAAKELGVQFLLAGQEGSGIPFASTNFSDSAPNLLAITGALISGEDLPEDSEAVETLRNVAVASLLGPAGALGGFGGNINDALFGVVINAVKRDTDSNLLSTPSVMTLDNQEARILVGQEVPISTGSVLSDTNTNPFVTIQRRKIGVELVVRPQINEDGALTLNLRQEVSSLDSAATAAFSEPVFSTREIQTTVLVDDGEIVALGGLLDESEQVRLQKVPGLGNIPGIGRLFRSQSRSRSRTNLMVFIRPRIVRTAEDARAVTGPLFDYVTEQQRAQSPTNTSSLEALVREYMGAQPPRAASAAPAAPAPAAAEAGD